MMIRVLHTIVTQSTVTCAERSVRLARLTPYGNVHESLHSLIRFLSLHLVATTPSFTRAYLGSTLHPPAPSLRPLSHFRSGLGSRLRGIIPGSRQAVLHCLIEPGVSEADPSGRERPGPPYWST